MHQPVRLLIVDAGGQLPPGLPALLSSINMITQLDAITDHTTILHLVGLRQPNVILLGLSSDHSADLHLINLLNTRAPGCKIILFGVDIPRQIILHALENGVQG